MKKKAKFIYKWNDSILLDDLAMENKNTSKIF